MLLVRRNPLSYPAGVVPRFDPSHVAAKNCLIAAIAQSSGRPIDLRSGLVGGDWSGTVSVSGIDGSVGPFMQAGGNEGHVWSCIPPGTSMTKFTFAGIAKLNSAGLFHCATGLSDGGNAVAWADAGTGSHVLNFSSNPTLAGSVSFSADVPYFYVISAQSGDGYILLMNMLTGQIVTSTGTGSGAGGTNGAGVVSWPGNFSASTNAKLAAAATINGYTPVAVARKWAQDPWSFWYPNQPLPQDNFVGAGGAASVGITGAGCSAQAGSVAITDNFVITGASVAAQAGSVTITESRTVSGAQAAAQAGTVSVTLSPSVAISGAQASASAGTVAIAESHSLTGAQVTAQAGSVADTVSVSVTGAQAGAQAGSVAETIQIAITGAGVVAQAGAVSVSGSISVSITGAQVTAVAGSASVSGSPSVPISGAPAAAQAGTVSETISKTLTGAQAAAQAGSVSEAASTSIAGAQSVAQSGVVADIISKALAGAQVAAQAGSVAETVATLIQGALASAQAGSVSVLAFGPISISGAAVVAQAGIVSILNPSNTLPFQQASIKAFETTPSLKGYEIDPSLKGY